MGEEGRRSGQTLHTLALAACFVTALASLASGSGTIETPVLVLHVENQSGKTCSTPFAGLCVLEVQGDGSPQNLSIDAYQRVEYVGVATDFSLLRGHVGELWLLPDQGMTLRGSDLYIRYPFLRTLTETWQDVPPASEENWLVLNSSGAYLLYNGPALNNPAGPWEQRNYDWTYARPEEGEAGVGYEQIGPVNKPTGNSTDRYADQVPTGACLVRGPLSESECRALAGGIVNASHNFTPNIRVGMEFYDLQVATDPDNLSHGFESAFPLDLTATPMLAQEPEKDRETDANATHGPSKDIQEDPSRTPLPQVPSRPPAERKGKVDVLTQLPPSIPPEVPLAVVLAGVATAGLLAIVAAVLYSRFANRNELLQSETRSHLVQVVRDNPGICIAEAARSLGLTWNAIRHHAKMLERMGVVEIVTEGRRKTLRLRDVPRNAYPTWIRRNEISSAIFTAVLARPDGLDRESLRALLPKTPERTRNYHIRKLIEAGILQQQSQPEGGKLLRVACPPGPA